MGEEPSSGNIYTEELMRLLKSSDSFDQILQQSDNHIENATVSGYLECMLETKSLSVAHVIEKANLSRSYGYQVFNGSRNPARDVLIRIAVVMQLTLDETQRLLKIAQRGELYSRMRRDAAIIFGINRKLTLEEMDDLLKSIEEPGIFEGMNHEQNV